MDFEWKFFQTEFGHGWIIELFRNLEKYTQWLVGLLHIFGKIPNLYDKFIHIFNAHTT